MAQPSQSRDEPSMEDILSSIRKIIQNNDSQQSEAVVEVDQPAEQVEAEQAEVGQVEVRGDVTNSEPQVAQEPAAQVDVQSQEPMRVVLDRQVSAARHAQGSSSDNGDLTSAPVRADIHSMPAEPEPVAVNETQAVPTPVVQEPVSAPVQSSEPAEVSNEIALVSANTSSKVAASFSDLTTALTASSGKNLEEATNELLKPMLTEWLDDNLPTIVERLVREEIERVARGG